MLTTNNLTKLAELVTNELNSNSETYEQELDTVEKEILEVSRRLERIYEAIETGNIKLDDLGPRIHELRDRQVKLTTRKEELLSFMSAQEAEVASKAEVAECVEELRDMLGRNSLAERKALGDSSRTPV